MRSFVHAASVALTVVCAFAFFAACDPSINQRFTVSYDGNQETSGLAPVDGATYKTGAVVAVLGPGTLARTGYAFAGWNTAADGTGTPRAPESEFSMGSANMVLFAQWQALPVHYVTYDSNGASYGSVPTDGGSYLQGATITVMGSGSLVKVDNAFLAWNTLANGNGTDYAENASFAMGAADITLFAKWNYLGYHQMLYLANGATAGTPPVDANQYAQAGSVTALGAGTLARTDFVFDGWNTAADGSGTDYAAGSSFAMGSAGLVLYAKWRAPVASFNAQGGSAVADLQGNEIASIPASERSSFALEGWYPNASLAAAEKISFPFHLSADATLYAKWMPSTPGLLFTPVTGGYSVASGSATAANVEIPAWWLGQPVTALGNYGFSSNMDLQTVIIPASVTSMGTYAFYNCQILTTATINASVTSLPSNAFENCINLTAVTIPAGVRAIGSNAFNNCNHLESVSLPANLLTIGEYAFYKSRLTSINIPSGVTVLEESVFEECDLLSSITLHPGITEIRARAFFNDTSLPPLVLGPVLAVIGGEAFFQCQGVTTLTFQRAQPPSLGTDAFVLMGNLTDIFVPAGCVAAYKAAPGWSSLGAAMLAKIKDTP
jgi:uncharacterized repeat protein (TIGR02543 family)